MVTNKLEYDSALGGSVVLPDSISTYRYAAERLKEIRSLTQEMRNPKSKHLVFQSLPKYMRRRAMSHNPKRIPRKYRTIHLSQMSKAEPKGPTKRPSRKYRRKPSNLLKEYNRRQRTKVWLETHIWHAKRFHMIEKWGYRLPYSACNKTFRASYRATSDHCLLQDISYFCCLEITGTLDDIRQGFSHLSSPKCGVSITANAYNSGDREGHIDLFKYDQYPWHALTRVSFLWKPAKSILEIKRTVWIFVHPSVYKEVLLEFISTFKVVSNRNQKIPLSEEGAGDSIANESKTKTKTVGGFVRTPSYLNKESGLTLTELKDTLNRFRLTGPLSQAVLINSLKCKDAQDSIVDDWFKEYLQEEKNIKIHNTQANFWENCRGVTSPGQLIPNMIIGLNVIDPRLNRPEKRTKATNSDNPLPDRRIFLQLDEELARSSLWEAHIRNQVTESLMTTNVYCKERSKHCLVPGASSTFEKNMQPIPVLLIQRPGSQNNELKRLGYGCGWDVIIPSGYGLAFWLCMIMWGAKPGGLRETTSLCRESGYDQFLPDTLSGLKESAERSIELQSKYFRKPPNKRCNYAKFAIVSPFRCPFGQLINEWAGNTVEKPPNRRFFVLRDKEMLWEIQNALRSGSMMPEISNCALIPIYLKMKTRGSPGEYSIICLPKPADLKRNLKQKRKRANDPVYTEPLQLDANEKERKLLRFQHKKLLKRLRRRRIRAKRKLQEHSQGPVKIRPAKTKKVIFEQYKKMCALWVPHNPPTIRSQCSREVFGYVTQCDFSLTEATVAGIGYVTALGLQKIIKTCSQKEKLVLVRSSKSRFYRLASIKIQC